MEKWDKLHTLAGPNNLKTAPPTAAALARSDPGNAVWQRELAISYAHLADVYRQPKDREKALAALRQGKAIMDRLVKLSPDNAGWQRDLAWFDRQIAALTE